MKNVKSFIPYILIAIVLLAAGFVYAGFWRGQGAQLALNPVQQVYGVNNPSISPAVLGENAQSGAASSAAVKDNGFPPEADPPLAEGIKDNASHPGDPLIKGGFKILGGNFAVPAIVQTGYNSTYANFPTVGSVTLAGTIAGNTIVATAVNGNTADTMSISGCGNNWTQLLNNVTTTNGVFDVWTTTAPGGACATTVTPSVANNTTAFSVTEISGINGSDATPLAFRNSNCTTNCQTTTITPVTNGDLIFVWNSDISQFTTYSAYTNGFTQFTQGTSTSSGQQNTAWSTASLIKSTAASISAGYTISPGSSLSQNIIMAFKPASGPTSNLLPGFPVGSQRDSTTTAQNITGATLLVAVCGFYQRTDCTGLISDTSGNTWVAGNSYESSSIQGVQIFYVCGPKTSNSWQASLAINSFGYMVVYAFSGTATSNCMQGQNGLVPPSGSSTFQPGSVSDTKGGIVVTGAVSNGAGNSTQSIDSGFFTPFGNSNNSYELMWGSYLIPASTASVNPTWTMASNTDWAAAIMSFYPGVGGVKFR